jgi:RHS repeat-associated protein
VSKYSRFDPNPRYGRVAYTHGLGVDQPLSLVRIGLNRYYPSPFAGGGSAQSVSFAPFAAMPLTDWRGHVDGALYAGGAPQHCQTFSGTERCTTLVPGQAWSAYAQEDPSVLEWHGTLLNGKQDATGTLYRRARYYDPQTGRFTQEDPIGLAGGVNLYGYAGGDPVNYADPSGLCPVCIGGGIGALVGAVAGGAIYHFTTPADQRSVTGYLGSAGKGAAVGAIVGATAGLGYAVGVGISPLSGLRPVVVTIGELTTPSATTTGAATAGAATATKVALQFGKDPNQVYHAFRHVVDLGLDPAEVEFVIRQHLPTVINQLQPGKPLNQVVTVAGQRLQYTAFQLANGVINVGRIHGVP